MSTWMSITPWHMPDDANHLSPRKSMRSLASSPLHAKAGPARMKLYPLFADLSRRAVLVVGGGPVAERKVAALLGGGPKG